MLMRGRGQGGTGGGSGSGDQGSDTKSRIDIIRYRFYRDQRGLCLVLPCLRKRTKAESVKDKREWEWDISGSSGGSYWKPFGRYSDEGRYGGCNSFLYR